jgi:transaldolase
VTKLHELYERHGQSSWLDNLTRDHLTGDRLTALISDGIRGVTANPTILARAISRSTAYDDQFASLIRRGRGRDCTPSAAAVHSTLVDHRRHPFASPTAVECRSASRLAA